MMRRTDDAKEEYQRAIDNPELRRGLWSSGLASGPTDEAILLQQAIEEPTT